MIGGIKKMQDRIIIESLLSIIDRVSGPDKWLVQRAANLWAILVNHNDLVAKIKAAEREACAQLLDSLTFDEDGRYLPHNADWLAAKVRARGKTNG